ncbi:pyridoxamine 5'-phosphate oxidase family protein [Lentzea aerocolonigenes]|uniref:pyridoxamine 5'-phosphate oxidase family protein n=1 Tax=Lentzea aerocolonigenes TaxID=68170 RepID=UPI0018C8A2D6|nr:pyridoxamine 5'-phosphate oxidase family protein [Lentzea aerocolonigenes]
MDTTQLQPANLLGLIAGVSHGRLSFTSHALPAVAVVRHVVTGGGLLMRSGPNAELAAAARAEQVVAFEADDVRGDAGFGWWVTALGRLRHVDHELPGMLVLTMDVTWMNGYVLPAEDLRYRMTS